MEVMQHFEVKVPGSTANLGPGFDSFGLALPLFLTIRVKKSNHTLIKLVGDNLEQVPIDKSNLVYKTIEYFHKLYGYKAPDIEIELESEIPLSRGLGSSGAAIIGGLLAANQLIGNKATIDEIFQIAANIEGHPDNVGASLYGGFVITAADGKLAKIEKVTPPTGLNLLLLIPKYTLSTKVARDCIPNEIPVKDTAFNIGHASLFIVYMLTGQFDKLSIAMKDRVHQPYRQSSVKGLERLIKESENTDLFSTALSGAGPTILLLVETKRLVEAEKVVKKIIEEEKMDVEVKALSYSNVGAEIKFLNY